MGDFGHRLDTEEQLRCDSMTIASVDRFAGKRLANPPESAGLVEDSRIAPSGK